jgi:uncharacterized protein DUF6791/ThiF family protein
MSQQLISRSPDLKRLRDEGFDIEIRSVHLLLKDVPYVNRQREVKRGILVSELTTAGDLTQAPSTHVAMFIGEYPCDKAGVELEKIRHSGGQRLAEGLSVDFSFSSKPAGGYTDYYHKMTAYLAIIASHAQALDPEVTAKTFPVIPADEAGSVFRYLDTATSRARIGVPAKKLELERVAIVGLGGTGSYVLDLVAKTMVKEIHLFDGDTFLTHNAFRSPGAASLEELREKLKKTEYLARLYGKMRRGVHSHGYYLTADNVAELDGMSFVFLCMAPGDDKRAVVEGLEERDIPFVDAGMGVELVGGESLRGLLRVTASTPEHREHFRKRAPLGDANGDGEYEQNIQIADLNALNACLAVLKWKKICGFYLDFEKEHNTTYAVDSNALVSDDCL